MKKIAVVMGIIVALGLETEVYAKEINLKLDNNIIKTQVSPIQEFGTTLVPIRVVVSNLGAEIEWEQATQTITIKKEGAEIKLTIGSKMVYVNNEVEYLQCAPQLVKGTTMVPIRVISEQLGNEVLWEKETNTVIIRKNLEENIVQEKVSKVTVYEHLELPETARKDNYFERKDGYEYFEIVIDGEIDDLRWITIDMNKLLDESGTLKASDWTRKVEMDFGKVSNDIIILHINAAEGIPNDGIMWTWPSGREGHYLFRYNGHDELSVEVIKDEIENII